MVEGAGRIIHHDRTHHLTHIVHFATGADDNRTRADDFFARRILLRHREGVLAGRNIDLERATEVAEGFHSGIEARVFTLL